MTRVVLGNRKAIIRSFDDEGNENVQPGPSGKQATVVDFPEGTSLAEAFTAVTSPQGVWAFHAEEGHQPAWVASDSEGLSALLAEHFGGAEVRELKDPYDPETRDGRGGGGGSRFLPEVPGLLTLMLTVAVFFGLFRAALAELKTNAGNDYQSKQMGGAASATAIAIYVGLTANVTAPAAGDTTLTGEITTAGGGLIRKAGTYAHTTGAASYTITTVFTANGSDALPVTIGKRGIFDAAAAGNLVFETLVSPTATLSTAGDQLTLTDTVTL